MKKEKRRTYGIGLTVREREYLNCIVEGLCDKLAAKKLNVEVGTVKAVNQIIYKKLGVNSRLQAAIMSIRTGLVE